MSRDAKQLFLEYLAKHHQMSLATVNNEGNPLSRTLHYVNKGSTIFFMTNTGTRKVENIKNNAHVSVTIDEIYSDWSIIQGIQMEGTASLVTDPDEGQAIQALYLQKYPHLAEMPPMPDLVPIKVEPQKAVFIDNTVKWGHRDEIQF